MGVLKSNNCTTEGQVFSQRLRGSIICFFKWGENCRTEATYIYIYGCIWCHYIIEMMQLKFQPIAFEVPSQRFVPLLCAGAPKITQEKLWRQVDFFRHFKVDPLWWTVGTRSGKPHLPKIPEVFHHLFGSLKVEDGWNRVDLPENGDLSRHYIWNPVAHDPKQFAWSSMIFHTATLGLSRIWPWDLPSGNLT